MRYRSILTVLVILIISIVLSVAITGKTINNNRSFKITDQNFFSGNILFAGGDGPGNFSTIQEAINNANNGDTVYVYNGTYYEKLIINKPINLIGENKNTVIIDAMEKGNVIQVSSDYVNISDFTIKNSSFDEYGLHGISITSNFTNVNNNIIMDNIIGIEVFSGIQSNFRLHNNNIEKNSFIDNALAIYFRYSDNNSCCKNQIINNALGKFGGIGLTYSNNNIISNNDITNLTYQDSYGIALFSCVSNDISLNKIENSAKNGIIIKESQNNNIYSNNITNVEDQGIYIEESVNNNIHHNELTQCENGILISKNSNKNNISYNSVCNINEKGIYIVESNCNKIHHNNFIKCLRKATFLQSLFNRWHHNYWGRPRILPKPIFGKTGKFLTLIPVVNFDWRPAKKPYDI